MTKYYLNPYKDYGFKILFSQESHKPVLVDLLNKLLQLKDDIKDLSFVNDEQPAENVAGQKEGFRICCTTANGEKLLIKMGRLDSEYFKRFVFEENVFEFLRFRVKPQGEGCYKISKFD